MKRKSRSRSPIQRNKLLRSPGQSLSDELDELVNDRFTTWAVVAVLTVAFALMEWYRWYANTPPTPILITIIAIPVVLFAALRMRQLLQAVRRVKLGRDGERAVGQFLEDMREQGFRVYHDVVGDDFNIDHVIIGTKGIYTVETKTISLPEKKPSNVTCDGDSLLLAGRRLERNPIAQCKAQAAWLRNLLNESTGKNFCNGVRSPS